MDYGSEALNSMITTLIIIALILVGIAVILFIAEFVYPTIKRKYIDAEYDMEYNIIRFQYERHLSDTSKHIISFYYKAACQYEKETNGMFLTMDEDLRYPIGGDSIKKFLKESGINLDIDSDECLESILYYDYGHDRLFKRIKTDDDFEYRMLKCSKDVYEYVQPHYNPTEPRYILKDENGKNMMFIYEPLHETHIMEKTELWDKY